LTLIDGICEPGETSSGFFDEGPDEAGSVLAVDAEPPQAAKIEGVAIASPLPTALCRKALRDVSPL
jgi:hypothetical protein